MTWRLRSPRRCVMAAKLALRSRGSSCEEKPQCHAVCELRTRAGGQGDLAARRHVLAGNVGFSRPMLGRGAPPERKAPANRLAAPAGIQAIIRPRRGHESRVGDRIGPSAPDSCGASRRMRGPHPEYLAARADRTATPSGWRDGVQGAVSVTLGKITGHLGGTGSRASPAPTSGPGDSKRPPSGVEQRGRGERDCLGRTISARSPRGPASRRSNGEAGESRRSSTWQAHNRRREALQGTVSSRIRFSPSSRPAPRPAAARRKIKGGAQPVTSARSRPRALQGSD